MAYILHPSSIKMTTYPTYTGPYSLLITDKDEGCRRSIRETFEPEGYNTYQASCGREAIRIAREVLLHALIMDVYLPDISGLETFRFIKKETKLVLPCILLSERTSKELMLSALSAEAYTVISKPINLKILHFAMERIIRKYYLHAVEPKEFQKKEKDI